MKSELYVHFHPEERPFVDRAEEWIRRASELHELKRSGFLDPRQCEIVIALANRVPEVQVRLDGGCGEAERMRALIAPDYRELGDEPMGIRLLEIKGGTQGRLELTHGDYLGSLLGLGIKRDRIGDLQIHSDYCHCLLADEIAEFVNIHLRQVHRVQVQTELIPLSSLRMAEKELEEHSLSVASLRLDGIASDAYRISRAKIIQPIRAGRCRVNWRTEEDPSADLKEGDVVSLQGMGRFKLLAVEGASKKGRLRVRIGKFI